MAHHKQMNKEFLPLLLSRNNYKVMTTSNIYHQNIEFRGHRVQRFFKIWLHSLDNQKPLSLVLVSPTRFHCLATARSENQTKWVKSRWILMCNFLKVLSEAESRHRSFSALTENISTSIVSLLQLLINYCWQWILLLNKEVAMLLEQIFFLAFGPRQNTVLLDAFDLQSQVTFLKTLIQLHVFICLLHQDCSFIRTQQF